MASSSGAHLGGTRSDASAGLVPVFIIQLNVDTMMIDTSRGPSSAAQTALESGRAVFVVGGVLCRNGLYFTSVSLRGGGVFVM